MYRTPYHERTYVPRPGGIGRDGTVEMRVGGDQGFGLEQEMDNLTEEQRAEVGRRLVAMSMAGGPSAQLSRYMSREGMPGSQYQHNLGEFGRSPSPRMNPTNQRMPQQPQGMQIPPQMQNVLQRRMAQNNMPQQRMQPRQGMPRPMAPPPQMGPQAGRQQMGQPQMGASRQQPNIYQNLRERPQVAQRPLSAFNPNDVYMG